MRRQFFRYAVVGLSSNALLYSAYLLLTSLGIGHKTAMTVLYAVGILSTFHLNRRWTFDHKGYSPSAFVRYLSIYILGYVVSFLGLFIFVDLLEFRHQMIQAVLIILVAALLFVLQRFWVFKEDERIRNRISAGTGACPLRPG